MGFFEATDFSEKQHGFQIVRSHMSSHQGMILATLCNVLCHQYIARLFSDLPRVQAYRLLLQEKPYDEDRLDEIVELLVETVCSNPMRRAAGIWPKMDGC